MSVTDIMTRHVVTVNMDDSLSKVQKIFDESKFHHLIVVEEGVVVGVLSDRDLLKNISPFVGKMAERTQDVALLQRKVHQIMTRHPIVVLETAAMADAAMAMLNHRVSCVPVVDASNHCVGIVTIRDMLKWCVRPMDQADKAA